jgi:hypothetical protein
MIAKFIKPSVMVWGIIFLFINFVASSQVCAQQNKPDEKKSLPSIAIEEPRFWFRDAKKTFGRAVINIKNDGVAIKIIAATSPWAGTANLVGFKALDKKQTTSNQADEYEIAEHIPIAANQIVDLEAEGYFLGLRDISPTVLAKNASATSIPITIVFSGLGPVSFQAKIVADPEPLGIPKIGETHKGGRVVKVVPATTPPVKLDQNKKTDKE